MACPRNEPTQHGRRRSVGGDEAFLNLERHHVVSRALQHEQQWQLLGFAALHDEVRIPVAHGRFAGPVRLVRRNPVEIQLTGPSIALERMSDWPAGETKLSRASRCCLVGDESCV